MQGKPHLSISTRHIGMMFLDGTSYAGRMMSSWDVPLDRSAGVSHNSGHMITSRSSGVSSRYV
jgi:hypothetical protein